MALKSEQSQMIPEMNELRIIVYPPSYILKQKLEGIRKEIKLYDITHNFNLILNSNTDMFQQNVSNNSN